MSHDRVESASSSTSDLSELSTNEGVVMRGCRRIFSSLLSATLAVGLIVSAPVAASAGVAESTASSVNLYGVTYQHRAVISTASSPTRVATASTRISSSVTVSAGRMGTYPRLWSSAGKILKTEGYSYNHVSGIGTSSSTQLRPAPAGSYYSQGCVQIWNGGGYNTYCTTRSPNQNA